MADWIGGASAPGGGGRTAADWGGPWPSGARQAQPVEGPMRRSAADWYGGRNLQAVESGWDTDWYERAFAQRNEQADLSASTGNPGDFYNWFLREDATGVATWNDETRQIRAENGQLRGLRAGDTFDNGEFTGNLYDKHSKQDADLLLGEFVFDGNQKARLFQRDERRVRNGEEPEAFARELQIEIDRNSEQAKYGQKAYEVRELAEDKAEEIADGWWDEVLGIGSAALGGAAAGAVVGNVPGAVAGALIGGFGGWLNRDSVSEAIAIAQVQAEEAKKAGLDTGQASAVSMAAGKLLTFSVSPLSNYVAGSYDVLHSRTGDGVTSFNAVDPMTGERLAGGLWQAAHLGGAVADAFLQFGSAPALRVYQAGLVGTIGGKAMTLPGDMVWSDAKGGWYDMEDWGERTSAWTSVGIDAFQLGVSQWAVRAAQYARASGRGEAAPRSNWFADRADDIWAATPGLTQAGRLNRRAFKDAASAERRAPEIQSGRKFFFDDAGEVVAYRPTMVAWVPSEMTRFLPSAMQARYKAIRNGDSPMDVSVEDLYSISLQWAGNGGRMQDAMLNAFAEGSEEMAQYFLDVNSYSGVFDAGEFYMAGAYGAAAGLGMGIAPMLSRASTQEQRKANAAMLHMARTGETPSAKEWDERWGAMSESEQRRAATGTKAEMEEANSIARTIAEAHLLEVGKNGYLPLEVLLDAVATAQEGALEKANDLSTDTMQAKLLPNELTMPKRRKNSKGLFGLPKWQPHTSATTSRRTEIEYGRKLEALRQRLEATPVNLNDERVALEQEIQVVEILRRFMRGASVSLAEAADPAARANRIKMVNRVLEQAAVQGLLYTNKREKVELDPSMIRRGAQLVYARHPFIDEGSVFQTVPQVHPGYEANNMHGSIGLGINMAKVAQLDFDGDAPVTLHQVVFPEGKRLDFEAGAQYLQPRDVPREGGGMKREWTVNVGRPKDEPRLIGRIRALRGFRGELDVKGNRDATVRSSLSELFRVLYRYYAHALEPTGTMPDPFTTYFNRFRSELLAGDTSAVENFVQALVDHNEGQGGERIVAMGRKTHVPEVLRLNQLLSAGLDNIDRGLRLQDPDILTRVADPEDTSDIPETNRAYIRSVAMKDAATDFQTMQLLYGPSGERAGQHAGYVPFMQFAVDLVLADPDLHMTEQEISLARAFFLEAGPGRTESQEERALSKDATTERVLEWVRGFTDALSSRLADSAMTSELMPDMGLAFLVAGARSAEVTEDGQIISRDAPQGERRTDISLAQLMLRKSVMMDRGKHQSTRADDPIHANLTRLDQLSRRKGTHSTHSFEALREIFGDVPYSEYLPDEQAATLGPDMTMNRTLQMLAVMSKDEAENLFTGWMLPNAWYRKGRRSDAPWSWPDIKAQQLNAYTLLIDTLAAVSNNERTVFATRSKNVQDQQQASLLIVRDFVNDVRKEAADRVRAQFNLPASEQVTYEQALEYVLKNRRLAQELVNLFPEKARLATFRQMGEDIASRRWVRQALLNQDTERAELEILVESAIDLLNATGARINRDDSGKLLDSRPVEMADRIESRLAILINRLASLPSQVEIEEFFRLYKNNPNVDKFFAAINKRRDWIGNEPDLQPYMDSVKDFEVDPRGMWSAGTMNTQRFDKLSGMSDRLRMITGALKKSYATEVEDMELTSQLLKVDQALRDGKDPDKNYVGQYERLVKFLARAQDTAPGYGRKLVGQIMDATGQFIDQSDKGAAPEQFEAVGTAYALNTSMNLKPGPQQELERMTRATLETVLANPGILLAGPTVVQFGDGTETEIDLTTPRGFLTAMRMKGLKPLIYSAVAATEMDIDSTGPVSVRRYTRLDPGASLAEHLESLDEQFSTGPLLSLDEAHDVIQDIEGRIHQAAFKSGAPDEIEAAFGVIQSGLQNLMVGYSTRPDWHLLSTDQQRAERNMAIRKAGTLLFKMAQIRTEEGRQRLGRQLESLFVDRWYREQDLPTTAQELLDELKGETSEETAIERVVVFNLATEEIADELKELTPQWLRAQNIMKLRDEAKANGDAKAVAGFDRRLDRMDMAPAELQARIEELTELQNTLNEQMLNKVPVRRGMVNYRAAYKMYSTQKSDQSSTAMQRRKLLIETLVNTSEAKRLGVIKAIQPKLELLAEARRVDYETLLQGEFFEQKDWDEFAAVAAKVATANKTMPTGSSVLLGAFPGAKESDGHHYWDESMSFLARPFVTTQVLQAVSAFGKANRLPDLSPEEVADWAMTAGPFDAQDFGKWNPLVASTAMNLRKAMEGSSVTIGVTIGGNLPKTEFNAAVAGYSEWEIPPDQPLDPAKHHSTMTLVLDPSKIDWAEIENWGATDDGNPFTTDPMKLHRHFVSGFDFTDLATTVKDRLKDDEGFTRYLMKRWQHTREEAERLLASYRAHPDRYNNLVDNEIQYIQDQIVGVLSVPPGLEDVIPPQYKAFDVGKLQGVLIQLQDRFELAEPLSLSIEYVDVEKKPTTPEYRNHGLFDGVGRRSELETSISPWGAMIFGTGALSKLLQQDVFDYAAKGGTSYKPYIPTDRAEYDRMERDAGSVAELMRLKAHQMMGRTYEWFKADKPNSGKLLLDDWNAVYKMVVGRHVYREVDSSGLTVRYLWAEEAIALERETGQPLDKDRFKLVPLGEEVFRLLHGASVMQAGNVVSRPEWNPDRINRTPSLSKENLQRLGLSDLGLRITADRTPLSMVMPLPKANSFGPVEAETVRSTLKKQAEERYAQAARASRLRQEKQDLPDLKQRDLRLKETLEGPLSEEAQTTIMNASNLPIMDREMQALRLAEQAARRVKDELSDSAKVWMFDQSLQGDWRTTRLNSEAMADAMQAETGISAGDLAIINLASIAQKYLGNEDQAFEEAAAIIKQFASRGVKIMFVSPGLPSFVNRVSEWMSSGATSYTKVMRSKYVWEPVTVENYEGATLEALRSSLSATSTFLAMNAHVVVHWNSAGANVDENAGMVLRLNQLATPHTLRYQILPTQFTVAKIGQPANRWMFGRPERGSLSYDATVQDARAFLAEQGSDQVLRVKAATDWDEGSQSYQPKTRTRRTKQADGTVLEEQVADPNPKNTELYRVFEDTGIQHPGIRSFDDALKKLQNTLNSGRLPLDDGDSDLMAGDFVLLRDGQNRILFHRLGFEAPSTPEFEEMFKNGGRIGAVGPKLDESTVVPPGMTIVDSKYDARGKDFLIRAPLGVLSKIVNQGDATKYTLIPLREGWEVPEQVEGRNGRGITHATSSEAQRSKFGYSRPGTGFATIFSIVGMDDLRLPLVRALLKKQYQSKTEKGFEEDWERLAPLLRAWASYDFGLDEAEVMRLLNANELFTESHIDLIGSLDPLKQSLPGLNDLVVPDPGIEFDETNLDETLALITLGALASPRVKLEHIISTPGIWTVKDPMSSQSAILDMPDVFTDTLANGRLYPAVRKYFLDRANTRITRFPAGHPLADRPLGYWDPNMVYWQAMKTDEGWTYLDSWLSIDFPVTAPQNTGTYTNIGILHQKSGFTQHVASVLALNSDARMIEKKLKPGKLGELELIFRDRLTQFDPDNPQVALRQVLTVGTDPGYTSLDLEPAEYEDIRAARQAFREYDHTIDKSEWEPDLLRRIEEVTQEISDRVGIDNSRGSLDPTLDTMVRMWFGTPGPKKGQNDWYERVGSEDYLEALKHFARQLERKLDPMQGGALPLSPPEFMVAVKQAGKWAPLAYDGGKRTSRVASGWDEWVKTLFGQMINSPFPLEPMYLDGLNGLIQIWKDSAQTLHGMGLSLDDIRNLLPKNRRLNEKLASIELLAARGKSDPLVLDAWEKTGAVLRGERTPADITASIEARYTRANQMKRHRLQWAAKQNMPKPWNQRMRVKDYMGEGNYYLTNKTQDQAFFAWLTNVSHITRLADPLIFASGYIEQPWRMMFEHLTDLLTGKYTGRGGERFRQFLSREEVQSITKSDFVQSTLGFGDFVQTFSAEDEMVLRAGARALGNDDRWLQMLYEDAQYANLVQPGQNWVGRKTEKMAGFVARTFSDPLYGTSQEAAAMRYLKGVIEHLHAQGIRPNIPELIRQVTQNPTWLKDQYGGPGLDPNMAGLNRVKQIRSQKLTPFSRAVKGSVDFLTSSPHRFFKIAGWALNIPFAYSRFQANGLQFITGMDGWSQAASMFFSGRRRPKFLFRGGVNGNPEYWDLEDVLETIDLRHSFVRSGTTLTMLFTLGMLAGGTFGFGGENEEERRRRRQGMYMGLVDVRDPREPENNFLNADAIFLDNLPLLGDLFDDGKGSNAIVPHWIFRQFTSPIMGFSRFFETGDPREIGYGFLDAFAAVPYSVKRLWDEADATAKMLVDEAEESAADPSAVGTARTLSLLVQMVGIYERALFENQFINTLYVAKDRYDRDPWTVPEYTDTGVVMRGPDNQPMPTDSMVQYLDEETGLVQNAYLTRSGSEGARYQYAENNAVFAHFMALFSGQGFDSDYLRQNMVTRKREIELEETPEAKAEAAILALYMQHGGLETLTQEEIEYALKDKYTREGVWWSEADIQDEAEAIYASNAPGSSLSFMTPEGEVLSDWGGDRIIDGLVKGSIKLGSPELIGVSMDFDMRKRLEMTIKDRLVQDGLDLGLPQKTAEYRAKRFWYGEDDRPDVPGIKDILWSNEIPYSNTVRYNQLNVMYLMGPDGKPWATPYERKTMMQALLPLSHHMAAPRNGMGRDDRSMFFDEVLGINTGLASIERIPEEVPEVEPGESPFDRISSGDSDRGSYARNFRPWRRYANGYGRYGGGGGGGGGGGYTRDMRALPGGAAARFEGIQMINTSNPYTRRANVNRQRIWSERGRLKQWQ